MDRFSLPRQYGAKIDRMRELIDAASGKSMSDRAFEEYRVLENEADGLAGRISTQRGQIWGPRLDPEMSRVERLEAREAWLKQPEGGSGCGLEDTRAGGGFTGGAFRSFGEQLRAVVHAGTPGHQADPRLFEGRAASGLGETVGAEGGFALQSDFSAALLTAGMSQSELAPRCARFPISQNANEIGLPVVAATSRATGSRFGGLRLHWAGEGDQLTASKPKFGKLTLKPHKLTGLVYLTDELIQDAAVLEAFVRRAFAEEFGFTVDDAILRGSGVGAPLGILNSGALVTVAKESGQAAATLLLQNVLKMYARMPAGSVRNAVWLIHQSVTPQLFALNALGDGVTVFLPAGGVSQSPFMTLLGRPIIPIEQASALGAAGDIMFVDLTRYLLAEKNGLQVASSIHVRFLYDETALRFIYRVDGQPELDKPITPYQGSDVQSPYVALQAR